MIERVGEGEIEIVRGDITDLEVDAIVNPANHLLKLGAGVAGAIARKGGPTIQQECDEIGGTAVGTAVITGAGRLLARHVIHAVGPKMGEGEEEGKIAAATAACFDLAHRHNLDSLAFPAISTGVYGVPMETSASAMLGVAIERLALTQPPSRVIFCLFDLEGLSVFEETFRRLRR